MDEQVLFHLTRGRWEGDLGPVDGLRPALFARVGDVVKQRHDFPLVLLASERDDSLVSPLSAIVDELLREVAPAGLPGERMRRNVLRLEREIRALLASGARGTLGGLWAAAADRLAARGGDPFAEDVARAHAALRRDGELLPCAADVAAAFVTHMWRATEAHKARTMRRRIDELVLRLGNLVRADFLRSEAGRHADTLRAGVGTAHREMFDFDVMASLLSAPSGASALPLSRRLRIERTVATLRGQRFFEADLPFVFAFDRVEDALAAYRERLRPIAELVRGIAVAELELQSAYVESKHDAYFAGFDTQALRPDDLALFPDYLVRLSGDGAALERERLMEGLTSGAPLRIVVATDDAFGRAAQLASAAMGLGDAFVLQSSAAELYRIRERVRAGLEFAGPALFCVHVPSPRSTASLPTYLVAAAATESRAFPTFSYDPSAGPGWAERFALHEDPQSERAWPVHELTYAGADMQRVREEIAFTLADLAVSDPRHADHFARLPRERWSDRQVPIAQWLDGSADGTVPFVYAIDTDAGLHRLVVDQELAQLTRRCADAWRRLRELNDLKRERVAAPVAAPQVVPAAPVVAEAPVVDQPAVAASDEPYIETARCTSCNECTTLNPRIFAYNENKQAFIKDAAAGTFKDLVEAAEGCQVAIIHPGKPRDPSEPGLEDLLRRAEQFR